MIEVRVVVDLEAVDGGRDVAWWATAPSVGNLAIAAGSLRELENLARAAIDDILAESGEVAKVTFKLRDDAPTSAGAADAGVTMEVTAQPDAASPPTEATVQGSDAVGGQRMARELVAA